MSGEARFVEACRALALELGAGDLEHLRAYLLALIEANRSLNLTAVRDADVAWERHLLDSVVITPIADACFEDAGGELRVLDVGSGGGLPGIPLAIVRPRWRVTLLESVGKKAEALRRLAPPGVTVLRERAEVAAHAPEHRERYDLVTARAVAALDELAELTLPFARPGGCVLAMKGTDAAAELERARAAIERLGGPAADAGDAGDAGDAADADAANADAANADAAAAVGDAARILATLPGIRDDAVVVRIPKVAPTPPDYPRRPGMPKKRPLR